jgi:subtilisin family serine protease
MLTLALLALLAPLQRASPAVKIGEHLAAVLRMRAPDEPVVVWVTFADKGGNGLLKPINPASLVTPRSLARRRNVLPEGHLVDQTDLPIEESYVSALVAAGATIRQRTRWFNAVSVAASSASIQMIARLPCVAAIELMARYGRRPAMTPATESVAVLNPPAKTDGVHALDYGQSINQVQQINVPAVHDLGNHAEGVIVGVFDNGFRLLTHESLVPMHIIATHDFVDHKSSVVPLNPSTDFGSHGIETLSTIGGYKPGQLIGPAFGASFILARTENDSSETPVEEDNWLAAIEWADSLGVQVTSTSLGYLTYDAPYTSWTWEDMDGRTTLITRAAAMAVRKGIVVVNSAGNEGSNASHNTLGAPADADSVLAIGAVSLNGARTSFSSVGPTTSIPPRIKPELMALGTSVYVANADDMTGYISFAQGTSFSCPLAAGVAALLVKAYPHTTPVQIGSAMKSTASNALAPNNLVGWGIINAKAALDRLASTDTNFLPTVPLTYLLEQNYPNPFNPGTTIEYRVPTAGHVRLTVYDVLGREVAVLQNDVLSPGLYVSAFNGAGFASGVYIYRLQEESAGHTTVETRKMTLLK